MRSIFSVDVEDWFHILDVPAAPAPAAWPGLPSRVESNFFRVMELLGQHRVRGTCFFLGWIAQKYPHLVQAAVRCGHEIASHGCSHRLVYEMSREEFCADALEARKTLEDVSGDRVLGYRAPGFSTTSRTPWFFETLIEAGYVYDSSAFPAARNHGGMPEGRCEPYRIRSSAGELIEFPITVVRILGHRVCLFGGGYLRLFPLALIKKMAAKVLREGRPVILYVHPRELDPRHPRLSMPLSRRFKSYVNLSSTERKVHALLSSLEYMTFREYVQQVNMGPNAEAAECALVTQM